MNCFTITRRVCVAVVLLGIGTLGPSSEGSAALIAWDFDGLAGNEASVNATTQNISGSSIALTRGSGLSAAALANSFNSSSWVVGGALDDATSAGDYLQFSFTVPTLSTASLTELDANFRRSSTGPSNFLWQYDVGSGFTNIGSSFSFTDTATNGIAQPELDLSGISALQNMAAGTNVSFRLLGAGASNAGGTFALGRLSGDDLALNGSVTAIPEPTSLALCTAVAISAGGASWRKRRRSQRAAAGDVAADSVR